MLHLVKLLINEIYIRWILHWHYALNAVASLLSMILNFLWLMVLVSSGNMAAELIAPALVGYIVWAYAEYAIYDFTWNFAQEIQRGVLEQMFITRFPFGGVLMARALSNVIVATVEIAAAALVIMAIGKIPLPITWGSLPIIGITMVGIYGFALMLGSGTLLFKQIQAFSTLISWTILYLNGSIASLDKYPYFLQAISPWLPTTEGIRALQKITLGQATFSSLVKDGSVNFLIIHSALLMAIGIVLFMWSERKAKQQGRIGQY